MLQDFSPKIESDIVTRLALQDSQIRTAEDEKARTNIHLRRVMTSLIDGLDELLNEHANRLALARRGNLVDAFDIDECRDTLTWQLAEFLTLGLLPRDPDEPKICQGHQVTEKHAHAWFNLSPAIDGELLPVESDQEAQPCAS